MNKRAQILFGILTVLLYAWFSFFSVFHFNQLIQTVNNIGYDLQIRAQALTNEFNPSQSSIAIIDIDDKSLKAIGRWPWPRSKISTLVNALHAQGAAVIAFDLFFSENQKNILQTVIDELNHKNLLSKNLITLLKKNESYFDEDRMLAASLKESNSILALSFLPRLQTQNHLPPPLFSLNKQEISKLHLIKARGYISNIPLLQEAAKKGGFINIFADHDGIIRHAPLLIEYRGNVYPSLALQAIISFIDAKVKLITHQYGENIKIEGIQLNNTIISTNEKGEVLIPFIGKSYTFAYYSAIDVLNGTIPQDALLGKILFVGTSATGLGDLHASAIQNPFPGVEIQATLAQGLLKNNFSYQPSWIAGANFVIAILLGILCAVIFPYCGPRILSILIFLFPVALLFVSDLIWKKTGLVLFLLSPALLVIIIAFFNIIYGYIFETRRREKLKDIFGQYVPAKHIDKMLMQGENYGLKGENREMSVLFADIRNFTAVSETLTTTDLVELLNTFFTPMTEIIFQNRGTIDKYIGDMIMAFWGAPLEDQQHNRHAIQSSLTMQAKIQELNQQFEKRNWPEIKIGIGINSGVMSIGDMGSTFRRNYTVLGDAVNLASRFESLTKFYGVGIIAGEETIKNQKKFIVRKLDYVKVKGKNEKTMIYEIICYDKDLTPSLTHELDRYHQALFNYFNQQWDEAFTIMEKLHQEAPEKKLYNIYLYRITEFKNKPPAPDWDGVYAHAEK